MKLLVITILLLGAAVNVNAQTQNQLANTAWQGTVNVNQLIDVVFQFGPDTVRMYTAKDKELLETMTYTIKDDAFIWKKVSGGSPCDMQTPGTWRYSVKNDELTMTLVQDDCLARSGAWLKKPFKKVAYTVK